MNEVDAAHDRAIGEGGSLRERGVGSACMGEGGRQVRGGSEFRVFKDNRGTQETLPERSTPLSLAFAFSLYLSSGKPTQSAVPKPPYLSTQTAEPKPQYLSTQSAVPKPQYLNLSNRPFQTLPRRPLPLSYTFSYHSTRFLAGNALDTPVIE
jgi:hypothetical protein